MTNMVKVEGVGTLCHLNDGQLAQLNALPNQADRPFAVVAFGLGLSIRQFKKLPLASQTSAWVAYNRLHDGLWEGAAGQFLRRDGRRVGRLDERESRLLGVQLLRIKNTMSSEEFSRWIRMESGLTQDRVKRCIRLAKETSSTPHAKAE